MLSGACLCGALTYKVTGAVQRFNLCHCTMCQRASGAAFGAFLRVAKRDFELTSDAARLSHYQSSDGIERTFCRDCGSPVYWSRHSSDGLGIAAGSVVSGDVPGQPTAQFWCMEAPAWHVLRDDVVAFDSEPD